MKLKMPWGKGTWSVANHLGPFLRHWAQAAIRQVQKQTTGQGPMYLLQNTHEGPCRIVACQQTIAKLQPHSFTKALRTKL